ncbi:MAG TPA: dihydrodipicolinate reductase [Mycobacteriales bacterium]|nr:dihydrodipicolinate reductase [Mycobacteriales bacterium]
MTDGRLRVVQWATGNVGRRALRETIRHPDLELVGLVVYDEAKAGIDAGDLCGEAPTGVLATTDHASAIALDADAVIYMPGAADFDEVLAVLERGTNVITTCGDFQAGAASLSEERRGRLLDACRRGGSSIYATGSSPGFISDALPLALLSMQRRVDRIEIEEYANLSERDSAYMLFELMGFGRPAGPADEGRASYLLGQFGPALARLARSAGHDVQDWSATGELAAVRETTTLAAGELPAGTVGAQRTILSGSSEGREVVRFTANWYCSTDLDPAWDLLPTGWRVKVRGDAAMDVTIEFPVAVEDLGEFTPALTANRPVNAVPFVCAAAPGIVVTEDLPPLVPIGPSRD